MDHTNLPPGRPCLDTSLASKPAAHRDPIKRKWSPGQSEASTATVRSYHETFRGTEPLSSLETNSPRCLKRAKLQGISHPRMQLPKGELILPSDSPHLPGEMWQRIFTFLPPHCLEQAMRVNKAFHNLLTPGGILPPTKLGGRGLLRLLDQDHLWSISRRAFFPGMPRPLSSRSEFETWKLLSGSKCEYCGKKDTSTVPPISTSPWTAGPGNDHVRVIWPFAVRSCGNCLHERLQKVGSWTSKQSGTIFYLTSIRRKPIYFSPPIPPCCLHSRLPFLASIQTMSSPSSYEASLLQPVCS